MIVRPKLDYKKFRRKNYMLLEDQIDAIAKGFAHLEANGLDIGEDMRLILTHRNDVKSKFPKDNSAPDNNNRPLTQGTT
jgi:hypothetical protein